MNTIGNLWLILGETRNALEAYGQALPLFHALGDKHGEASILINIGNVQSSLGETRKAIKFYEQALPLLRAVGDQSTEANMLYTIGGVWDSLDNKRTALDYYQRALLLFRAVGDLHGETLTHRSLGLVYRTLGFLNKATEFTERSVKLAEEIHHPDLEDNRRTLEQLKAIHVGKLNQPAQEANQAPTDISELGQIYLEKGEDGVRDVLKGQESDEFIEETILRLVRGRGKHL